VRSGCYQHHHPMGNGRLQKPALETSTGWPASSTCLFLTSFRRDRTGRRNVQIAGLMRTASKRYPTGH